ncbi:VOC family protein [Georgenia faecalis]|uniref:2-oxoadipate dioxygenase/decarboxylase n=1 Tax=Georgenia faecalis TaxID=2483799 RepID=A0ABV9DA30_9MICO|nr:VOC family protein [Georgenia faecalis]
MSKQLSHWQLRARFARGLSDLYGREVPAYTTLVEVSAEVNEDYRRNHPDQAERLGSIQRVTAERHGAIRVGSPRELAQAARVFGAAGMSPVGFYDLREAKPNPVPVVSTAFRPIDREELARNPFRVFTSMLVPQDRRFFSAELEQRLEEFIGARTLFSAELLELADRSIADAGLSEEDAEHYLELATGAFALSPDPVDRRWYATLDEISSVAADIGGVASTHINHLTPRVLDIDELYARMEARGIAMIDAIQGPPRWGGPDVLLRQTSFRALAEPRTFLEADGSTTRGDLRVRFGEVEARGIALTVAGRNHYDHMLGVVDDEQAGSGRPRPEVALEVWERLCPRTERALLEQDLAFFAILPAGGPAGPASLDLLELLDSGLVRAEPIVYEDFLPRSAAGIFASNLTSDGAVDETQAGTERNSAWMGEQIGVEIHDPYALYAQERQRSFDTTMAVLGLDPRQVVTPWS